MSPIASIQSATAADQAAQPVRAKLVEAHRPLWELFEEGQVLELSGTAAGKLSVAARLMLRAQQNHEIVAYVAARSAPYFYAPDLAAMGIDLGALVCVRMPESAGSHGLVRAAEVLLRAGAFGLVVLELGATVPSGELAWQARLTGLVRHHSTRLVLITASDSEAPSLGPLVTLRTEPRLVCEAGTNRAVLEQRVLKSKLGFQSALSPDVRHLPQGAVLQTSAGHSP
jgi:hypothetical protein